MRGPHTRKWFNQGYDSQETRVDIRQRCSVCGFAGIDPERTGEPDHVEPVFTRTGTVYNIPVGTPANQIAHHVDMQVETVMTRATGCPLCGSPAWAWGSAPSIRR